jgi:hypothetical protein
LSDWGEGVRRKWSCVVSSVDSIQRVQMILYSQSLQPTDEATAGSGTPEDVTSQITVLSVESKARDVTVRVLKQMLETPHGVFVLQEIYGVAGVAAAAAAAAAASSAGAGAPEEDAGGDPGAADCVVCLTNKRELAILPCRCASWCWDQDGSIGRFVQELA